MSSIVVRTAEILAAAVLTLGIGTAVSTGLVAAVAAPVSATSHMVLASDEGPNGVPVTPQSDEGPNL
jgi:hypothetical protein